MSLISISWLTLTSWSHNIGDDHTVICGQTFHFPQLYFPEYVTFSRQSTVDWRQVRRWSEITWVPLVVDWERGWEQGLGWSLSIVMQQSGLLTTSLSSEINIIMLVLGGGNLTPGSGICFLNSRMLGIWWTADHLWLKGKAFSKMNKYISRAISLMNIFQINHDTREWNINTYLNTNIYQLVQYSFGFMLNFTLCTLQEGIQWVNWVLRINRMTIWQVFNGDLFVLCLIHRTNSLTTFEYMNYFRKLYCDEDSVWVSLVITGIERKWQLLSSVKYQ